MLRTLDVFSETELRIKFLRARSAWLAQAVKQVHHTDGERGVYRPRTPGKVGELHKVQNTREFQD